MTVKTSPDTSESYANIPFHDVLKCVHCGLCLDACPTYAELGVEQDSPRGRLYLMRGLWEGELPLDKHVVEPLARCLDCRACETACPAAVPYGELLEKTRGVIAENLPSSLKKRLLESFFLKRVLPSSAWMRFFSRLGWLYRLLGFPTLITRSPLARILPKWIVSSHWLMPRFAGTSFKLSNRVSPSGQGCRVALFTGCIMDVADIEIHEATVTLLQRAGCQVTVPRNQACCGALHVHGGERKTPRQLARTNEAAFDPDGVDVIIVNAAGCGAQLREYAPLFSDTPQRDDARWSRFGDRVSDILVFLASLDGFCENTRWRGKKETVLYDAPCHLIHAQKTDAPRALLASVPAIRLVGLTDADRCCGAAGIYNLTQANLSEDILAHKLDDIEQTLAANPEATTLVTGNPGCLFQIRAGVNKRGLPLRVLHPVQLLAECLAEEAVSER